jgi:hypothetical protein
MVKVNRGERLQIMLNDDELKAVDDWRFAKRMPSRASAIRRLLRLGLAAAGSDIATVGSKSKDYGVTAGASKMNGKSAPTPRAGRPPAVRFDSRPD